MDVGHIESGPLKEELLVKGVKLVVQVNCDKPLPFNMGVTFTLDGKTFPLAEVNVIELVGVEKLAGAGLPLYNQPLFAPKFQL